MLDRPEESGYIRRVRSTEDRRAVSVRRTMKDESFRRAFLQLSAEMTDKWYRGFSKGERAQFETFLKRILANLEKGT